MEINHNNKIFPVILEEEEAGGYVVINPALPGCYSQGETIEEALENIREATELCIEDAEAKHEQIRIKNVSLHLINLKNKYA
jgi:predicted RNase H-like HicB family nuclease